MNLVTYLVGFVSPFAIWFGGAFVLWAFAKETGAGECTIEGCRRRPLERGEHFNLTVWLHRTWHQFVTNRPGTAHRRAVMDFWRPRWERGAPVHRNVRRWLEREARKDGKR